MLDLIKKSVSAALERLASWLATIAQKLIAPPKQDSNTPKPKFFHEYELEPDFAFRLAFELPRNTSFQGDEQETKFNVASLGRALRLRAIGEDRKLASDSRYAIIGDGFPSEAAAQQAAWDARIGLLMVSASTRHGVDVGQYRAKGFGFTNAGKELIAQMLKLPAGAPILEDHLGAVAFPVPPSPAFVKSGTQIKVGLATENYLAQLGASIGAYSFASNKAELGSMLYAASHFEASGTARFLVLVMVTEVLIEPKKRSAKAQDFVQTCIDSCKKAGLDAAERDALMGGLARFKDESIARSGRLMAEQHLSGATYMELPPGEFFAKMYKLRNELMHHGANDARRASVGAILAETDRFVSELLQKLFVPRATADHPASPT